MAITISVLALLAMLYQLYLQRIHNEKSVRPLGQIDLPDYKKQLAVHIRNNGLGPLIIDKLTFVKDGHPYTAIDECLDLDPRSYMRVSINDALKRVVLPNTHLVVFETQFDAHESETAIDHVRNQLTPIMLKVRARDIYDNKIAFERDFRWFSRNLMEKPIS